MTTPEELARLFRRDVERGHASLAGAIEYCQRVANRRGPLAWKYEAAACLLSPEAPKERAKGEYQAGLLPPGA